MRSYRIQRSTRPACCAGVSLLLALAMIAEARAQYQDITAQQAGKLTNDRVQSNISDQGSGYGPRGPYGQYFSTRNNPQPRTNPRDRQPAQTGGLPDAGRGASGESLLSEWYRRRPTGRTAEELGVSWADDRDHLVVGKVVAEGEMSRAGLQAGDHVVSVAGQPVGSASDWQRAVDAAPAGEEVPIVVERDGKSTTVNWTPKAKKAEEIATGPATPPPPSMTDGRSFHFITAARLRRGPDGRSQLGIVMDRELSVRAMLLAVEPEGAADEAGLHAGDTIVQLSGRNVASIEALVSLLATIEPETTVEMYVQRPLVPPALPQVNPEAARTAPARSPGTAAPAPSQLPARPELLPPKPGESKAVEPKTEQPKPGEPKSAEPQADEQPPADLPVLKPSS